jgi:hypothetical protein
MFGRLYYHLDHKYRYKQDDGSHVNLFAFKVRKEMHCVNFPYLCGILSEKQVDFRRTVTPFVLTGISVFVSLTSLLVSVVALLAKH